VFKDNKKDGGRPNTLGGKLPKDYEYVKTEE